MHLLPTNLAPLADLADKKGMGSRFTLSGVHLRVHGDNAFTAEATDTKVLLRVSGPCVASVDEYPEHPGMKDAPNGSMEAMIPATTWSKAFASAAKTTRRQKGAVQSVAVKMSKEMATFGSTDLDSYPVEQTRLIEGRFPPAADIIDQTRKSVTAAVWVDPIQMARALKAIAAVGCDEDEQSVEILFTGDHEKPFMVRAERANGVKSEMVMMPLGREPSIKAKGETEEQSDSAAEMARLREKLESLKKELEQATTDRDRVVEELKGLQQANDHSSQDVEWWIERVRKLTSECDELREQLQTAIKGHCDQPRVESANTVPLTRRERLQRAGAA